MPGGRAEGAAALPLQIGHGEEDRHEHGGEELQVVGVEAEPQDDDHDDVIHHAAEGHEAQAHPEAAPLAEEGVAQHLADDDGGQTDDDRAAAHVDVGKALILRHEAAGEGDEAVGEAETQHLHVVDVDALRAAHGGVGAGGAHGAALLGAEIPVEQRDDRDDEDRAYQDALSRDRPAVPPPAPRAAPATSGSPRA